AVLRMYFSLFCGRSDALAQSGLRLGLTRREAWTFVALVFVLVGFGIAPRPLVESRLAASRDILRLRQARMLGRQRVGRGHIWTSHAPSSRPQWIRLASRGKKSDPPERHRGIGHRDSETRGNV